MRRRVIHFKAAAFCLTALAFVVLGADTTSTANKPVSAAHRTTHAASHSTGHITTKHAARHSKAHVKSGEDTSVPTSYATATPVHTTAAHNTRKSSTHSRSRVAVQRVSPALRQAALTEVTDRMVVRQSHIENAAALVPFFELMASAQRSGQAVHLLQFGDSHTASDDWVNAMRISFQAKYGSGGPGFTHAGHPFRGYRRFDVSGSNSTGWV